MSRPPSRPSKPRDFSNEKQDPATLNASTISAREGMEAAEAARYIAAFALELSSLARRSGLDFLAYLLDVVRLEAERSGERRD